MLFVLQERVMKEQKVISKRKKEINWRVILDEDGKKRYYGFGWWMIEAATRGALPYLPLRNICPEVIPLNEVPNDR